MALIDPNLGLMYGWALGESGWGADMDKNLKKLGAIVALSVLDRDLTNPPTNPINGDRYIIPVNAVGEWADKTNQIAVRVNGVWEYYMPTAGLLCYVIDEGKLIVYTGSVWSNGISI